MEYVLTEKQAEEVWEYIRDSVSDRSSLPDYHPLAENKNENIGVIRINETVYVCEYDDFSRCIATGNLAWWESVKHEYFAKGFTDDFDE